MDDGQRKLWNELKTMQEAILAKVDDWEKQRDVLHQWIANGQAINQEILEQSRAINKLQARMLEIVRNHIDADANAADWWKDGPQDED